MRLSGIKILPVSSNYVLMHEETVAFVLGLVLLLLLLLLWLLLFSTTTTTTKTTTATTTTQAEAISASTAVTKTTRPVWITFQCHNFSCSQSSGCTQVELYIKKEICCRVRQPTILTDYMSVSGTLILPQKGSKA